MPHCKRILVAVDETEASRRAVAYVADVIDGSPGFHVGLLHLELPPRMLEWGGSEDPAVEEKTSEEREAAYRQVEGKAMAAAKAKLRPFQALLAERGTEPAVVLVRFEEPLSRKRIADDILQAARERQYGTVVVGRHLSSLWEHFFSKSIGERLIRGGEGVAVWVVE
jgi:nucleotide-binding universal stress UspA family protein